MSAFSNHGGGVIILGLDENANFAPVPGFEAAAIRDAAAEAFRPRGRTEGDGPITPRPVGTIDVAEVGGEAVVVIDIAELPPDRKPAFVTTQGKEAGTYERVGDGDRRMNTYGVFLLSTAGSQPTEDAQPINDATVDDLDPEQVERFVTRLRRTRPRSISDLSNTAAILQRHRVLAADGRTPTLAGMLALGRYPQQFLPQAMITFAAYPGRSKSEIVGDTRMLDRRVLEGPLPTMVEDAVRALLDNLKTRRVSRGAGAADEPEIPVDALREAVANALTHRDYSAWALGEQVRIELYPDRVEISNPGGIWGGRQAIDLFDGSSRSRNQVLSNLLTEVPLPGRDETVSENAGSGIPRMTGALGRYGLAIPRFEITTTEFTIVLDRHGLLSPESSIWLERIGATSLDPDLQRTLVMVHRDLPLDDQVLRVALAIDSDDARQILRHLVEDGWLKYPTRAGGAYRTGSRLEAAERGADSLFADIVTDLDSTTWTPSLDERILAAVSERAELGINEIAQRTGSTANAIRPRLRVLIAQGALVATASPQSRNRRYRLGATTLR